MALSEYSFKSLEQQSSIILDCVAASTTFPVQLGRIIVRTYRRPIADRHMTRSGMTPLHRSSEPGPDFLPDCGSTTLERLVDSLLGEPGNELVGLLCVGIPLVS